MSRLSGTHTVELGHRPEPVRRPASVEKHVTAIFRKLHIAPADTEHRRVQAVLTYLRHRHQGR